MKGIHIGNGISVVVESDCVEAIEMLNKEEEDLTEIHFLGMKSDIASFGHHPHGFTFGSIQKVHEDNCPILYIYNHSLPYTCKPSSQQFGPYFDQTRKHRRDEVWEENFPFLVKMSTTSGHLIGVFYNFEP